MSEGYDFSDVRSAADAQRLADEGLLVPVAMFPLEFGGTQEPGNTLYIPPATAEARELVIGTIGRFLDDDLIDQLDVTPEYHGDSFVPARIVFHAWHTEKPGGLNPTVEVW